MQAGKQAPVVRGGWERLPAHSRGSGRPKAEPFPAPGSPAEMAVAEGPAVAHGECLGKRARPTASNPLSGLLRPGVVPSGGAAALPNVSLNL